MTERDHWLPQQSGVSDPHQQLGRHGNAEVWLEGRRERLGEKEVGWQIGTTQGGSPEHKQATSLATKRTGGLWSKSLGTGSRIPGGQEEKRTLGRTNRACEHMSW